MHMIASSSMLRCKTWCSWLVYNLYWCL